MPHVDRSSNTESPDLLRRFIPTPVKANYRIGGVRVLVQTNDLTLLPTLLLDADLDADHIRAEGQNLEWTLIRDADSHGLLERALFVATEMLTGVVMGRGCLVWLDHERRQLLGFIGADIDVRTYQEFLVPLLCRMSDEVVVSDPRSRVARWSNKRANG
jgi:hypothetical protein